MTYDDINSYTSHAEVFLHRANKSMNLLDSIFWNIKVKQCDDPYKKDIQRLKSEMKELKDCLDAVLTDYKNLEEEIKLYNIK